MDQNYGMSFLQMQTCMFYVMEQNRIHVYSHATERVTIYVDNLVEMLNQA